jgi:hypothetical protein
MKKGGGAAVCNILDKTPKLLDLRMFIKQIISAFTWYEILV